MPFYSCFGWDRVEFSGLLTPQEISFLADTPSLRTLQFERPVNTGNWPLMERLLFSRRPNVCLRAYQHGSRGCNVSFVKHLPSLQYLSLDCLQKVSGLEALETLPNLRHLAIGVNELESFDFLSRVSVGLKSLILGPTFSKKPDLSVLGRLEQLEELFIGGHLKGLPVLASLPHLGKLRFSGLKSPNLNFLPGMQALWSLEFLLGGAEDFSAIAGVTKLKQLEITWVRRLSDIEFISDCINLQHLTLEKLRQVKLLPSLERLSELKRLTVIEMNGLECVDPIGAAPALEVLTGSAGKLEPEQFRLALQAPSLKAATIYFSSQKKAREFESIARENGVSTAVT